MRNPLAFPSHSSIIPSLSQTKQLHALLVTASSPSLSSPLYNSLIRAYARARHFSHAFSLFARLLASPSPKPDGFTFATVLRACADNSDVVGLKIVHSLLLSSGLASDLIPATTLVSCYSKLGLPSDAFQLFDEMPQTDLVLYNSMLSGFRHTDDGHWRAGLELFRRMRVSGQNPDGISLVGLLSCFRDPDSMPFARAVHGFVLKSGLGSNSHVRSVLVSVYSRMGCQDSGYRIFREVLQPDLVTWSAVITGLSRAGRWRDALDLFGEMNHVSTRKLDSVLIASVVSACASLVAVGPGREIHGYAFRVGMESAVAVSSALIDLYSKCGFAGHGFRVFEMMPNKNSVTYNSVISGLGANGLGRQALGIFNKMLEDGLEPDKGTFLSILCACAHSGLLEEGMTLFRRMTNEFGIEADMEHFVYMVKLMGMVGKLDEALELIEGMPELPGSSSGVWGALLWGCGLHGRSDLSEIAGRKLLEMDPRKGAYRVMLSNMYASEEKWMNVKSVRDGMMGEDVKKVTGMSWLGDRKG